MLPVYLHGGDEHWNENRESMLIYSEQVCKGYELDDATDRPSKYISWYKWKTIRSKNKRKGTFKFGMIHRFYSALN